MRPPIVRLGHPILRFPAEPVDLDRLRSGQLDELVTDLREALVSAGARILTAPQIGAELQILVVRGGVIEGSESDSQSLVVVNPMLEIEHGDLVYDWEGCLSIPDLKGLVPRYPVVRLRGFDHSGDSLDLTADGEASRLLQHAHDHLSGVVYLDRMRDLRSLAFGAEWSEFLSEADLGTAKGESTD